MDGKFCIHGILTTILAIIVLALAGCSDTGTTPIDAPKVAANQAQPTATSKPTAIPEPTVAPEPTPTSVPPATPEPAPTAQASQQESLEDLLQDDIARNSIELLKRDPYMHLYSAIFLMNWVEDGVSESEREHLALLLEIAVVLENVAEEFIRIPWLKDGMNEDESRAMLKLAGVADHSEEAARIIMGMD